VCSQAMTVPAIPLSAMSANKRKITMTTKLVKCAICYNWHSPKHHCENCGAFHLHLSKGKTIHVNRHGITMVRGLPADVDGMLNCLVKYVSHNVGAE
jgi:ribosomal protein L32